MIVKQSFLLRSAKACAIFIGLLCALIWDANAYAQYSQEAYVFAAKHKDLYDNYAKLKKAYLGAHGEIIFPKSLIQHSFFDSILLFVPKDGEKDVDLYYLCYPEFFFYATIHGTGEIEYKELPKGLDSKNFIGPKHWPMNQVTGKPQMEFDSTPKILCDDTKNRKPFGGKVGYLGVCLALENGCVYYNPELTLKSVQWPLVLERYRNNGIRCKDVTVGQCIFWGKPQEGKVPEITWKRFANGKKPGKPCSDIIVLPKGLEYGTNDFRGFWIFIAQNGAFCAPKSETVMHIECEYCKNGGFSYVDSKGIEYTIGKINY